MTMQDYREEVRRDLLGYARESWEYDHDITAEEIMDNAWNEDSVTGNGSGRYTFSSWQAQQNINELIWDEELLDMFREFGDDHIPLEKGAEVIDVSIRCFLVSEFSGDVESLIDELNDLENNDEKYTVNYHTGACNDSYSTLTECIQNVNPCYTQQSITIEDSQGTIVASSAWWGVPYDPEVDENNPIADFGECGYYSAWVDSDGVPLVV